MKKKFLLLTSKNGAQLPIDPDYIVALRMDENNYTIIDVEGDFTYTVKESIPIIIKMVETNEALGYEE